MHSSDRPTVSPSPTCRLLFRRLLHPNVYVHTYTHPYRSYIHTPLRSSTPDRFLVLPSAVYAHTYLDRMLHILHALSRPTLGLSRNGFAGPSSFVFVLLISISYFLYYCFFPLVLFALISSAHCIRYHSLDSVSIPYPAFVFVSVLGPWFKLFFTFLFSLSISLFSSSVSFCLPLFIYLRSLPSHLATSFPPPLRPESSSLSLSM